MAKIKREALISDFQLMRDEHWAYEAGAAENGKVDCSGAFVKAYRDHGKSIYHGSNRIAREYVHTLLPIDAAEPGMAAFKFRESGTPGYALPDDYKPGGAHYNGDLRDYYHIGLIDDDGVSVLNAQSTATGFVDSPIGQNWGACACLIDVDYDGGEEPEPKPEPQTGSGQYRVVGGRLNLRKGPAKTFSAIRSLKAGEIVEDLGGASGEWMKVRAGREQGYALREFLKPVTGMSKAEETATVQVPRETWDAFLAACCALMESAVMGGDNG